MTTRTPLSRMLAIGASLIVALGLSATGLTAANAAPDDGFSVSGIVHDPDFVLLEGVEVTLEIPDPGYSSTVYTRTTGPDGAFEFTHIPVGGPYNLEFLLDGYGYETTTTTVVDSHVTVPAVLLLPLTDTTGVTATVSGTGLLGSTLTLTTSGWPADTVFTYQWFAPDGNSSGDIPGAESDSYVVTVDVIGRDVNVFITGQVPGRTAPSMVAASNSVSAYAEEQPTGAPPADLDDYLLTNGSTPAAQTSVGLPSGPLNPGTTQTADLEWTSPDSYVDVYVFSTPVRVGTFRVVNGVARITLSPAVLGQLATGSHTLVATGQTSGAVASVRLSIGLAATGSEAPVLPLSIAAFALLAGGGLLVARRRARAT